MHLDLFSDFVVDSAILNPIHIDQFHNRICQEQVEENRIRMQEVVCKLGHGNIATMCALPVLGRFSKNSALGLSALPSLNFCSKILMLLLRKWVRVMFTQLLPGKDGKRLVPDSISFPPERINDDCTRECYF